MASDITSGCTIENWADGSKQVIWIETAATADSDDTIVFDLSDYGAKTLEVISGYIHSTTDSIIIAEAQTTEVSSGELTITLGGSSADDQKRVYILECDC